MRRRTTTRAPRARSGRARVPWSVRQVLGTPGRALEREARAALEPRFGHDFGRVRVHTGPEAAESARALGADAWTAGRHVVFGAGRYAPSTGPGLSLLAHELAHVVQQNASPARGEGELAVEPPGTGLEREAHAAAGLAASGRPVPVRQALSPAGPGGIQRAEHGTYVSTRGPQEYLNAGERFYRSWGHPNVKRVSNMEDVLTDLDRAKGTIDSFRLVSHATGEGLWLGMVPELATDKFGSDATGFSTEEPFRERFTELRLVQDTVFDGIYAALWKDPKTKALLSTLGGGAAVPGEVTTLGIVLRALVDERFLAEAKVASGDAAKIANRGLLDQFNTLRIDTYGGLLADAAGDKDKAKEIRKAIRDLRGAIGPAVAAAKIGPLTADEEAGTAGPFIEDAPRGGKRLRAELTMSIREGAGGPYLKRLRSVKTKVTEKTHVEIRGCNVGSRPDFLDELRGFFGTPGALPSISAPDLYQYFFQLNTATYGTHPTEQTRLEGAFDNADTGVATAYEDLSRMKAGEMTRVVNEKTLSDLAAKYGFDAAKVRKLNPEIDDPDQLAPGQVVWLVQRTAVPLGFYATLDDFCEGYLGNRFAWPKVWAENPWLQVLPQLVSTSVLKIPPTLLKQPYASPTPTAADFAAAVRGGKGVAGFNASTNRPSLHLDVPKRAQATGDWLAAQKFDPRSRAAAALARPFGGRDDAFERARTGTYIQFLSRGYPQVVDPIYPEDPRYDKHIIRRP